MCSEYLNEKHPRQQQTETVIEVMTGIDKSALCEVNGIFCVNVLVAENESGRAEPGQHGGQRKEEVKVIFL